MSVFTSILGSVKPSGGIPSPPAFTNVTLAISVFNLNPAGYITGNAVNYDDSATDPFTTAFLPDAPYGLDWNNLDGIAPYDVNIWYDQSGNLNNITQSAAPRPTLSILNKAITFDGTQGMVGGSALF